MGGKAFIDTSLVPRERVSDIFGFFKDKLGLIDSATLGSSGKKELSGDVDIAVSIKETDFQTLTSRLVTLLGPANVNTLGRAFNQIYTRYQYGSEFHQVDFMIGEVPLLEFTHWAPHPNESRYTGTHRTELIKAVAKVVQSESVYHKGRMVARNGYTLHHDRGLVQGSRWCPPRKDGDGYTSKMVAVSDSDLPLFLREFPSINAQPSRAITSPLDIVWVLFQQDSLIMVNSYENVSRSICGSPSLNEQHDLIWRLYVDRLDEIKHEHPERLI